MQVSTIKILLADADEEFRILLNDTINAETDMEVVGSVGDGNEALELINAGGVDVLVMDLVLSGMDGLELLHKIGDVGGRRPTILVVSGFTRGNVVNQSAALGADFFLTKPCRLDSVTERIRLLRFGGLESSPSRQNLETLVTAIIHEIGVPAHIKGYQYLREAIHHRSGGHGRHQRRHKGALSRGGQALRHHRPAGWSAPSATPSRWHGIGAIWRPCRRYFGYTVNSAKGKPTNSEFIAMIADRLQLQQKQK